MQPYLPHSHKAKLRQGRRIKIYAFAGAAFLCLIFIFAFFRNLGFFEVTAVVLRADLELPQDVATALEESLLSSRRAMFFGRNHYFAWGAKTDFSHFSVREVSVVKKFFRRRIEIAVDVRDPSFVWCFQEEGERCFWVDAADGVVLHEAPKPERGTILTVFERNAAGTPGDLVLSPEALAHFGSALEEFSLRHIAVTRAEIIHELKEARFATKANAVIHVSLRFDASENIAALGKYGEKNSLEAIQYADLTVPGKLYVKAR